MWTKIAARWLLYITAAWMLASLGVNRTCNPFHYIKNIQMQEQELHAKMCDDGIVFDFLQDRRLEWLSFWIDKADAFYFDAALFGITDSGEEELKMRLTVGQNTLVLPSSWKGIRIPGQLVSDRQLIITDMRLTEYEKILVGKALYITASFVLCMGFWECVQWVKRRYTG